MVAKIKKQKNVQKMFNKKNLNLNIIKIVFKHISLKKSVLKKIRFM